MNKDVPELVESFTNGDDEAFIELMRRYRKKVYSTAYQLLGNHLDADEVVQETFVRLYKRRKELARVEYFSSFLLRIATNFAIDLLRRRKGQATTEDFDLLPQADQAELARRVQTPQESYEGKELMAAIQRALDLLPPRQRITAILHDVEGYSKAEIAHALKCPEATVRSNLHIARMKLRKLLHEFFR